MISCHGKRQEKAISIINKVDQLALRAQQIAVEADSVSAQMKILGNELAEMLKEEELCFEN